MTGNTPDPDLDQLELKFAEGVTPGAVAPTGTAPVTNVDMRELQSNLSALLYLITEQHALIAELLSTLLEKGVLDHDSLVRVTAARKDKELTSAVYKDLYTDFINYFLKTKWILMSDEEREAAVAAQQSISDSMGSKDAAGKNVPNDTDQGD
jgi:hypothetical protein